MGDPLADLDAFDPAIQPSGHPDLITLGLARPFPGGVRVAGGVHERVLVQAGSPWRAFLIVCGIAVVTLGMLIFLRGAIAIVIAAAVLVPLALAVLLLGRRKRHQKLVVDARRHCCDLIDGARVVASIPASEVQRIWIQVHESEDHEDLFDVLIDLGTRELWIAQLAGEPEAKHLAGAIASALAVRLDAAPHRKS